MDNWLEWIYHHAEHAHWYLFGASLLAGFNIPISIDLLMIIAATLAAAVIPVHTFSLFFSILFGCLFSAWISYWLGRTLGSQLIKWPILSKIFHPNRMKKVKIFYQKRGHFALVFGRFIPFGVRNCLFMSSGMSQMPFPKFILWDGIAVTLWSAFFFPIYYTLGKNIEVLYTKMKWINFLIFIAFGVTVIGFIWYKKRKNP